MKCSAMFRFIRIPFLMLGISFLLMQCSHKRDNLSHSQDVESEFQNDIRFMSQFLDILILGDSLSGQVAISPGLQGRVMTSTAGASGNSYGWINRELMASGDTLDHINAFGGEERFWMGPEGGQYGLFFAPGTPFTYENWQTPRLIDLDSFNLDYCNGKRAVLSQTGTLTNHSGFSFDFGIRREIQVLSRSTMENLLDIPLHKGISAVGYTTANELVNTGIHDWKKDTGLPSIWLLGMFKHTPATVAVVPFIENPSKNVGGIVNDSYFGKVPGNRLKIGEGKLLFLCDGDYRSKIGVSPYHAKDVLGAYDIERHRFTIVKFNKPGQITDYVNSMWEYQQDPYGGDVVNVYNDGPPPTGGNPLGPFYELETSSPALALKASETYRHVQHTLHLEGKPELLEPILVRLFDVTLAELQAFVDQSAR